MTTPARLTAHDFVRQVFTAVADALSANGDVAALQPALAALAKRFTEQTGVPVRAGIVKADATRRMVYGWASVTKVAGQDVEDRQGDVMDTENLRKTVHAFMADRVGKTMHSGGQTGVIADSIVLDAVVQQALGVDLGMEGWFVGYHVTSDDVWKRVESGELQAFSIGGLGTRTPLPE